MGDTSIYLKLGVIKPPQTRAIKPTAFLRRSPPFPSNFSKYAIQGFSSLKGSTVGVSSSASDHETSQQRSKLEKRIRRRFGTRIVGVDQEGTASSSVQHEDELSVLSSEGSLSVVPHSRIRKIHRADDLSSTCRLTFSEPIRDDSSEIGSELSYRTTYTEGSTAGVSDLSLDTLTKTEYPSRWH